MATEAGQTLEFDIWRSVVLGVYIQHWGMPSRRKTFEKAGDRVEIYEFPDASSSRIVRLVTVGVARLAWKPGLVPSELLLVIPADYCGGDFDEAANFLADAFAHSQRPDVRISVDSILASPVLAPKSWRARNVLFDEPRGESKVLAGFHVGATHIRVLWVVPIHQAEVDYINKHGMHEFGLLEERSEFSLVDPTRPSLV